MDLEPHDPPCLNIIHCVTVKLNEQNFFFWKRQFQSFLSGQRLFGFVTGTIPQPVTTILAPTIHGTSTPVPNPDHDLWFQTDQVVQSWLLGSITDSLQSMVMNCSTAQEIWSTLETHFNRPSNSRLFELQHKMQTLAKGDKKMFDFLQEVKALSDQLASIGAPMTEAMKIFSALCGLGRDYEPIKTAIEGSIDIVPPPTFESIFPHLVAFDDRLQGYNTGQEVTPHLAFASVRTQQKGNYYSSRGRGGIRGRGRGSYSTRGRGFHQQISSSYDGDTRPTCQICGKPGHHALKCYHRFDSSYQLDELPQALAAMHITEVSDDSGSEWYPDSAASAHVTSSTRNLHQSQPYHGTDTVMVGDGSYLPITHTGSTSIASSSGILPLNDVIVCPQIAKSLLFVSKVTDDYPCTVEFDNVGVSIKDKVTKKVLTKGRRANGIYRVGTSRK